MINFQRAQVATALISISIFVLPVTANAESRTLSKVAVSAKNIDFKAKSNLSAIEITGSSQTASGTLDFIESAAGIELQKIKITIPVENLTTGIAVRDRHMKEKIFMTDQGKYPDITFESSSVKCSKAADNINCLAVGSVGMHGQFHNSEIPVKLTKAAGQYVANADFNLELKDFGIEPPKHFGVSIDNSVGIKTAFVGKVLNTVVENNNHANAPSAALAAEMEKQKPLSAEDIAQSTAAVTAVPVAAVESSPLVAPVTASNSNTEQVAAPEAASTNKLEITLSDGTTIRGLSFDQLQKVMQLASVQNKSSKIVNKRIPASNSDNFKGQEFSANFKSLKKDNRN